MATYYLPSSSGSYETRNQYVKYRIRIVENSFNPSTRKLNITVQAYFYRTNSGYTTDYTHKLTYTINGTAYSYNNAYGAYPITNSGVYLNACTVDVPVNTDGSVSVSVYCQYIPTNDSSGLTTSVNGGTISLTKQASSSITISFNANGGTNAPSAVSGTPGSITIPSAKPTREGYTFDGWVAQQTRIGSTNNGLFVEKNGTNLKYFRITRVNPNILEVLGYGVNLNSMKVAFWTVAGGQDDLIWHVLNPGTWERNGKAYNFGLQVKISDHVKLNNYQDLISYHAHWYGVNTSGSEVALHCPGNPYIDVEFMPSETYPFNFGVTLYAQWKVNTLIVKYNANGGSVNKDGYYVGTDTGTIGYYPDGTTAKHWSDTWTYNNAMTNGLQDPESFGLYRKGYTFEGWCINSDGSGTVLSPYDASVVPTDISSVIKTTTGSTVSLYAVWKIRPNQNVYFLRNGTIYARAFFEDTKYYIDSTGAIHAPSFTVGSKYNIAPSGITAIAFKEGTP